MTHRWFIVGLSVLLFAVPSEARAHLVSVALGPFYDGALHLLLSPADQLALLAVTLVARLGGKAAACLRVIMLPPAPVRALWALLRSAR